MLGKIEFNPTKLITRRVQKGFTQNDLAYLLRSSSTAVSSWERGKAVPNAENIIKLSYVLEVPFEYFYDIEDFSSDKTKVVEDITLDKLDYIKSNLDELSDAKIDLLFNIVKKLMSDKK